MQVRGWKVSTFLNDIRFWILFFFLVRLTGISNAPLEIAHNWRQALTNMIARNYYNHGTDFIYPMVDMGGPNSGIIGSEFPFYNWLIYLFSLPFGFDHWYGRLINLAISSIGIYYFFKLIRATVSSEIAFHASIILIVSIWFSFSRKIMPDTFSVALVIIALYHCYTFLTRGKWRFLIYFFILITLGVLCKIPAMSLMGIITIVPFLKSVPVQRKVAVFIASIISFCLVCLWYFYWIPYLVKQYHFELFFPKNFIEGFNEVSQHIPELLEKFYFSAFFSYLAFAAFIIGLVLFIRSAHPKLKIGIVLISSIFILFIFKTGAVFPTHSYYIVPLVPVMAIIAAFFTTKLPRKYGFVLLGLIAIESMANQYRDFFVKESVKYKLESEEIANRYIPADARIIINGGASPQPIYFFNRKGWTLSSAELMQQGVIDSLSDIGASYLIVDKVDDMDFIFNGNMVFEDINFKIYRLVDE